MDKKIIACISTMVLFQIVFSMDRPVPSLQTLSSRAVAKNIEKALYSQFPQARPTKRSLRSKLSIDADFSKGGNLSEYIEFIDAKIKQLNGGGSVPDVVGKEICLCVRHIIDKAGRYVAQHYYNKLNGSTVDVVAQSSMSCKELFGEVQDDFMRRAIAHAARYNFVLHYGYDKKRFDNHYFFHYRFDDEAVNAMYCKYFESRTDDLYLNHGATAKGLFFKASDCQAFSRAAVYFRHTLIKVALERSTSWSMLQDLRVSHTVTNIVNDNVLYQQECKAAHNSERDILLWSQKSCEGAIADKMDEFMWYSAMRKGITLVWLFWVGYSLSDVVE